jgi:methionyl-tRNA formyltransferase
MHESAVKLRAQAHGLALAQPASLKETGIQSTLRVVGAQAMVVAAYGLILPPAVLNIPARGCLNIHASLLPRWRGAAPIQRALLAGDTETGITIMQMDEGLDTGPVLLQQRVALAGDDTAQTLHDKLARVGATAIVQALRTPLTALAQDSALATYAEKVTKADALIDWSRDAEAICRQVRAFNPSPGAATAWNGSVLKIWRATVAENGAAAPGTVVKVDNDGIVVAAGAHAVKITELQKSGGKRLPAAQFLAGAALVAGSRLGT